MTRGYMDTCVCSWSCRHPCICTDAVHHHTVGMEEADSWRHVFIIIIQSVWKHLWLIIFGVRWIMWQSVGILQTLAISLCKVLLARLLSHQLTKDSSGIPYTCSMPTVCETQSQSTGSNAGQYGTLPTTAHNKATGRGSLPSLGYVYPSWNVIMSLNFLLLQGSCMLKLIACNNCLKYVNLLKKMFIYWCENVVKCGGLVAIINTFMLTMYHDYLYNMWQGSLIVMNSHWICKRLFKSPQFYMV